MKLETKKAELIKKRDTLVEYLEGQPDEKSKKRLSMLKFAFFPMDKIYKTHETQEIGLQVILENS